MTSTRCRVEHPGIRRPGGIYRTNAIPWREVPWTRRQLTFAFGPCDGVLAQHGTTVEQAQRAVISAMTSWQQAVPSLVFIPRHDPVDLEIGWFDPQRDPECLDYGCRLSDTDHAHADFPPPNTLFGGPPLPIHFNASERWAIDGHPAAFDIETVALHELGHCLGLFHCLAGTIMEPHVWPGQVRREIDPHTQLRIAQLYPT